MPACRAQIQGKSPPLRSSSVARCCWLLASCRGCPSSGKNATNDEPLHLVGAWIQTHYFDFRCNPEDPPLWKYYVAAGTDPSDLKIDRTSPGWTAMLSDLGNVVGFVTDTMYRTHGNDPIGVLAAARTGRMVVFGVLLVGLDRMVELAARRRGGGGCRDGSYSLDPNFLAHGSIVKNDVLMTLVFLGMMMAVWLLGERATVGRWLVVSLLLVRCLTTKFSGILAIPMLGLALLCRAGIGKPWPIGKRTAGT